MNSRARNPILHFDDALGVPLAGGKLYTYASGTTTQVVTYNSQGNANENPVRLNMRGEADVWLDPSVSYRFVVKNRIGVTVLVADNVTADTMTYSAEGSDTISVSSTTSDGKTVTTFAVKDSSIGRTHLKDVVDLIPDTQYFKLTKYNDDTEGVLSFAAEVPDSDNTYTLKMVKGVMTWVKDS